MIRLRPVEDIQLIEARSHTDMNPKISAYDALKPYSNNPDYFISFTKLDKLGINPKSKYDTPLGIYTYPLKDIWKEYRVDQKKSVGQAVPFAGTSPYIWLVKVDQSKKFVNDMYSDYGSNDYDKDKQLLLDHIAKNRTDYKFKDDMGPDQIDYLFFQWTQEAREKNPVMSMWNITRSLSRYRKGTPAVQWNYLLREVLGYSGFADRSGRGYIHPSEPVQAVFLSTRAFSVVAEFLNKDYISPEEH